MENVVQLINITSKIQNMQLIKNATFLNLEKHNKFTTILHNKLL